MAYSSKHHKRLPSIDGDDDQERLYPEVPSYRLQPRGISRNQRVITASADKTTKIRFGYRSGWATFFRENWTLPLALTVGLLLCMSVIFFTNWFSRQSFSCPDFAINCSISQDVIFLYKNIGIVQGAATAFYTIGLAALAYAAHCISESLIWLLLAMQPLSITDLDRVLSASKGSIPSSPLALVSVRTLQSTAILLIAVLITVTPLTAAPLVGYVYDRQNGTELFDSKYNLGGGIARLYGQNSPPDSLMGAATALYNSWAFELSSEPMPEVRDYILDRTSLLGKGNFTVSAAHVQASVSCEGFGLEQVEDKDGKLRFSTHMHDEKHGQRAADSSRYVEVRTTHQMAVWVDDYDFIDNLTTSATIVFAANEGTIEGASRTKIEGVNKVASVEAIACTVTAHLVDSVAIFGTANKISSKPQQTLSSVDGIHFRELNISDPRDQGLSVTNEYILWHTVAPALVGLSVNGKEPMWISNRKSSNDLRLPTPYTSTNTEDNDWTRDEILDFIQVSTGAVNIASARSWTDKDKKTTLTSEVRISRLQPSRVSWLIVPPLIILLSGCGLAIWSHFLHNKFQIPIMRLFTISELLKSSQTRFIRSQAAQELNAMHLPSSLGHLTVKFGLEETDDDDDEDHLVAGLDGNAKPFRGMN